MTPTYTAKHPRLRIQQRGLTLIELLVALGLGLLVVSIGLAALIFSREGYSAVDHTTQLRDRERFAVDLITRLIIQAGYQDLSSPLVETRASAGTNGGDPEPDIFGWNNAFYATPDHKIFSESTKITNGNRPAKCTVNDTSCKNGSDILIVRFQGVNTDGGAATDNTIINCAGRGEPAAPTGQLLDRALSIIHVSRGTDGEPSLSCVYNVTTATGSSWFNSPIIEGVESFQLLFGTDDVVPGVAPTPAAPSPTPSAAQDSVAERWLRADQLTVAGNYPATRENWRRVRAVRVGMVLRGPVGSAPEALNSTFRALGINFTDATNDVGSSLSVGTDRRLRVTSTFTVHLRNELGLR